MTVEAFTPAPPLTVAGIGPYAVPHPYTAGSLSVVVEQAGVRVTLAAGSDWTVTPTESTTAGSVYLSPAAAATFAGATLYTLRATPAEQGWQGVQGEREKGLELQLDRLAMLAQEAQAGLAAALRVATGTPVIVPGLDRTIIWNGTGFEAGPSADEIEAAQTNADLARRWASELQGTPVVPGQFSAFHWAQIALAAALAGGPPLTRQIATDTALGTTGGGDLSANRTIALTGQALRLHQLAVNGLMVRVDATTLAGRSIAGTTDQISVANPAGAAGNPTLSLVLPSQAEAEAGTDPNKPMPSLRVRQAIDARIGAAGAAPVASVRAWVVLNAAGAVQSSMNVSSVTKGATGTFTANFTVAAPNTSYFAWGVTSDVEGYVVNGTRATGSFGFTTRRTPNSTLIDPALTFVAFIW